MNFEFNLKEKAPVYGDKALTAVLTAVAVVYALGKKAGGYYFANREEINEDLRVFAAAVVEGTKNAYNLTYQLGADARVAYEENKPAVKEALDKAYAHSMDRYNEARCYLEERNFF
ncbi:hypothetical protein [Synechococcus phage S-N03]|uniref:Uncharacterized protein n=1 Tax=Synechococcus phage S-N03 TaxID=2718943 RepID=A0A6G8R5Q3_9CAUD|nr:hypothetical protein PQC09_gp085 [Synechococcus phage S-N03]QIN96720.1 hypothetical protein [Synechococcus phage S-N03]